MAAAVWDAPYQIHHTHMLCSQLMSAPTIFCGTLSEFEMRPPGLGRATTRVSTPSRFMHQSRLSVGQQTASQFSRQPRVSPCMWWGRWPQEGGAASLCQRHVTTEVRGQRKPAQSMMWNTGHNASRCHTLACPAPLFKASMILATIRAYQAAQECWTQAVALSCQRHMPAPQGQKSLASTQHDEARYTKGKELTLTG